MSGSHTFPVTVRTASSIQFAPNTFVLTFNPSRYPDSHACGDLVTDSLQHALEDIQFLTLIQFDSFSSLSYVRDPLSPTHHVFVRCLLSTRIIRLFIFSCAFTSLLSLTSFHAHYNIVIGTLFTLLNASLSAEIEWGLITGTPLFFHHFFSSLFFSKIWYGQLRTVRSLCHYIRYSLHLLKTSWIQLSCEGLHSRISNSYLLDKIEIFLLFCPSFRRTFLEGVKKTTSGYQLFLDKAGKNSSQKQRFQLISNIFFPSICPRYCRVCWL